MSFPQDYIPDETPFRQAFSLGEQLRNIRTRRLQQAIKEDLPIRVREFYQWIGFNPRGKGENIEIVNNPINAVIAKLLSNEAKEYTKKYFPRIQAHNNQADAFRHALWSYLMAQRLGEGAAKLLGDAHEITRPNPDNERLMDLYNNQVGRQLARQRKNKFKKPEQVILDAIKAGQLRLIPFKIK